MSNQLVKASDFQLEEKQVKDVDLAFAPTQKEREVVTKMYTDIVDQEITPALSEQAKDLRKMMTKIKGSITKVHKTQKAYALQFGRYCDAWKNKEIEPLDQMIEKLKEIEKHEEIKEQLRLTEIQSRREKELSPYVEDAFMHDLAAMSDEVWKAFLLGKQQEHKQAQEEAKKREEQERIEAEKQRKIQEENERLRKELEAKEKAEREELEAKQRAEQEELNKDDTAKIADLVKDLTNLKTKYSFKSEANKKMYSDVGVLLQKVVNHVTKSK